MQPVVTSALVFGTSALWLAAGVLKLRRPTDFKFTLIDFGVPVIIAAPLAVLLPVAELALGVAILVPATMRLAAWAMAGSLVIFSAAVLNMLRLGRRPSCGCFGDVSAEPIGAGTVVRNGALIGAALWLAGAPASNHREAFDAARIWADANMAEAVLFLIAGVYAVVLVNLMRQNGALITELARVSAALEGATVKGKEIVHAIGTQLDEVELEGSDGRTYSLTDLTSGAEPVVLIFLSAQCRVCRGMAGAIARWQQESGSRSTIVAVSLSSRQASEAAFGSAGLTYVVAPPSVKLAPSLGCAHTPCAVTITAGRTVGSSAVHGPEGVEKLVSDLVAFQG